MKLWESERIIDFEEIGEIYATKIFQLEKELGAYITKDYLLMKFHTMYDELVKYNEELKREQNRRKMSR